MQVNNITEKNVDDQLAGPKRPKAIPFGTKAETLSRLAPALTTASILPQLTFSKREWQRGRDSVCRRFEACDWSSYPVIVRSSAFNEDNAAESNAGHYTSFPNLKGTRAVIDAIEKVLEMFTDPEERDQVFVQPMLVQVIMSGVAFSKDPNTGGDYIVVNYDDQTADTSSVTSGKSNDIRTYYQFKHVSVEPPPHLSRVVSLCFELEKLLGCDHIDIEFAMTKAGDLVLLQVRPLVLSEIKSPAISQARSALKHINDKVHKWMQPHPYLHGDKTVFGVMPDWNPAEIIGVRPRPLALSMYKELITDGVWAYQRDNYGYGNLRSFPLIIDFGGLPYIDVRVSFSSFIPAKMPPELASRLVNYYINRLIESPGSHDKVEFDIIYSCYTLDLPTRLQKLTDYGFSQADIQQFQDNLRDVTNTIINGKTGLWKKDIEKIGILEERRKRIIDSSLDEVSKMYWLIEDCKRYGTLPFAGLARAGFIAVQFLRSLVDIGVFSSNEYAAFMETLETISTQMGRDLKLLSKKGFLHKYGHLRPGTYDILSPRYDEEPDRYFDWDTTHDMDVEKMPSFSLTINQLKQIEGLLKAHRLDHDILGLFDFIKGAIEGREYAKFVFTKSVSAVLSMLSLFGEKHGVNKEDLSYCNIMVVKELYDGSADPTGTLIQSIIRGKVNYEITKELVLPPLITSPADVFGFHIPKLSPNFITQRVAQGHISFSSSPLEYIKGSILLIPSADPGFDWIFSHNIVGFITMYGGVNSHMAIRAGELGIPAVIGIGETQFNRLSEAKSLKIDAANQHIKIIK